MKDDSNTLASDQVLYRTLSIEKNHSVSQTTVLPGGQTEWHHHTSVHDRFVVVQGVLTVETKIRDRIASVRVADYFAVEPGVTHHVRNETQENVVYINVQSGGERDIVIDRSSVD